MDRELEGHRDAARHGRAPYGYCSDTTRTWVVDAEPSEEVQRVWNAVRAAQLALRRQKPGARTGDADAAARKASPTPVSTAATGTSPTGSATGSARIHEPPTDAMPDVVMEPGMCFTNEPGIYQPGKFGLRIEDICFRDRGRRGPLRRLARGPRRAVSRGRPGAASTLAAALRVARKELWRASAIARP